MASSERSVLGAVIGAIACFLCIGLVVSIAIESSGATMAIPPMAFQGMSPSSSSSMTSSSSRSRPNAQMNMDPLNTIKRRVPNGADPIHNRREGKSGRLPGRA